MNNRDEDSALVNWRADKVPPPLNPGDPLNQFVYSLGGDRGADKFQTLPGLDGIPHRAQGVRLYKENDPAHMRPKGGGQVRCEVFNTGNPKEKVAYELVASRIYTMAMQEKAVITAVERSPDPATGYMRIYFEWIEFFTYDPTKSESHSHPQYEILRRS